MFSHRLLPRLGAAAAELYALSSAVLARTYFTNHSEILYWHVVGMLLAVTSIVIYPFIRHQGDPISRLHRLTTFLYCEAFLNGEHDALPEERCYMRGAMREPDAA